MSQNPTESPSPLSPEALAALQSGYQAVVLREATRQALSSAYPPGAHYVDAVVDSLYDGDPISARDRERCLIALLAVNQEPFTLSVHVYWGLMEGLSLGEIAHTLLLAGAYHGMPVYTTGLLAVQKTCGALSTLVVEQNGEAVSSAAVLQRLLQAFGR